MIELKISPLAEADLMENYGLKILEGIINKRYLKRIKDTLNKKELISELKKISEENKKELLKKKKSIYKEYNKLEKVYNNELGKIFGNSLKRYKVCYLTPVYKGIANVHGNSFFIQHDLKEKVFKYIFFHELTYLHYVDFIKKFKKNSETGRSLLMESIVHMIIFKTNIKRLLNIKIKYSHVEFIIKNKKFMKELEKIWKNREDFDSFLEGAIKLGKKTKKFVIC